MAVIEYFYAAHSAFAYLGAKRLHEIATASGRQIVHRPIDLGQVVAAANPIGFNKRKPGHRKYYFGRQIERWAEHRQVAFKGSIPPNHSNSVELANSMLIACIKLADDTDSFAHAIMQAHWRDHADLADKNTLSALASSVGLDAESLYNTALCEEVKNTYSANTGRAIELSVFGSPTYIVDGDMFYGQDHLELVERALIKPFDDNWTWIGANRR
jgi:2-hydroxychromene-2-carboxylate isomerase